MLDDSVALLISSVQEEAKAQAAGGGLAPRRPGEMQFPWLAAGVLFSTQQGAARVLLSQLEKGLQKYLKSDKFPLIS